MDIKAKRLVPGAQGSAAGEYRPDWFVKASSWQSGAETTDEAIRAEARENNLKFGTPDDDSFPDPASSNGNGDATLPNPHNFSSNPGYMGSSTASMLVASSPGTSRYRTAGGGTTPGGTASKMKNPTVGRSPVMRRGSVSTPAPGDTDPRSEGSPQGMTSGYSGG